MRRRRRNASQRAPSFNTAHKHTSTQRHTKQQRPHAAQVEALGVAYVGWEEMLPQCDVVSLHLPLLPATKYFIDVSH